MDVAEGVLALARGLPAKQRLVAAGGLVRDVEDQTERPKKAEGHMPVHGQMRLAPAPALDIRAPVTGEIGKRIVKRKGRHFRAGLAFRRLGHIAPDAGALHIAEDALDEKRPLAGKIRKKRPELIGRKAPR